jgi:DNA primase
MSGIIEEVKQKVPIEDYIAKYYSDVFPIQKRGANYWALCPFHPDNNPSMSISPEKQIATCFACQKTVDLIGLVAGIENMSMIAAAKKIAADVGIKIEKKKSKDGGFYARAFNIVDMAMYYYRNGRQIAVNYLRERGFPEEVVERFDIGFVGNKNPVTNFCELDIGMLDIAQEIGLVVYNERTRSFFDFFKNRIIIPIKNPSGKIIAFAGRAIDPKVRSKYINSPTSRIFEKKSVLYNVDRARKHRSNNVIIVEGYLDAIALDSAGLPVVATCGTALTDEHAEIIKKIWDFATYFPDPDKPGQKAAMRAVEVLESHGIRTNFIQHPDDLSDCDPADIVLKHLNRLPELIRLAKPYLVVKAERLVNKPDYNSEKGIKFINIAAKILSKYSSKVHLEMDVAALSKIFSVSEDAIIEKVSKTIQVKNNKIVVYEYKPETEILWHILWGGEDARKKIFDELMVDDFENAAYREVFSMSKSIFLEGDIPDEDNSGLSNIAWLKKEVFHFGEFFAQEFVSHGPEKAILLLTKRRIERQLAEETDFKKLSVLQKQLQAITKKIRSVDV